MRTDAVAGKIQVSFTAQTKAEFSVLVCNRTQLASCQAVGIHHSVSVVCTYYFLSTVRLLNISNCIHFIIPFIALQLESVNNLIHAHTEMITGMFFKVLILISH